MALLDGDFARLFGAAFASLYRDATLSKAAETDDGSGGFALSTAAYPALALVEARSDRARAASGLPDAAVTISVLRAGLPVAVDLDDALTVAGARYRVIRVEGDPAGAAFTVAAVPA